MSSARDGESKEPEPVEDFAAAGPPAPEPPEQSAGERVDYVQEEADELERHSRPGVL